jgi:hypothetical protein
MKPKSILQEAHDIVFERAAEKERQYGPFIQGMSEAAKIASLMSRKEITTTDMFNCMIALKLSRQSYNHKQDNILDLVAYAAALNEYENTKQTNQ